MPSYMFYRNRRTPFNFGYPEVEQRGLPAFFSRLKEDYNEAKERLAQDAAKKQTWQYQHAKISASGEKTIALLATSTIKLVFHDMVRLQKLAEQKDTRLPDLPAELLLLIFEHLDAIDSTYLGLTCESFYRIHRSIHGSVPLWTGAYWPAWKGGLPVSGLWLTLEDWFPAHLHFNFESGKYVTEKAFKQLEKKKRAFRDARAARRRRARDRGYRRWDMREALGDTTIPSPE